MAADFPVAVVAVEVSEASPLFVLVAGTAVCVSCALPAVSDGLSRGVCALLFVDR